LDKRLSRVEDELLILAAAGKSLSEHVTVMETSHDTYWSITQRLLASFNPAVNGMHLLGAERLEQHRLHVVAAPDVVSVDLRKCYGGLLDYMFDLFVLPVMTESVLNTIGGKCDIPLIMDTGASCYISPRKEDFVEFCESKVNITDLSSTNQVAGEGLIRWKVLDANGAQHDILIKSCYIPRASIHLLSPQCLLQIDKTQQGYIRQDLDKFSVYLGDGTVLNATYGRANIPILPMYIVGEADVWVQC
jgi:hypothetical protein